MDGSGSRLSLQLQKIHFCTRIDVQPSYHATIRGGALLRLATPKIALPIFMSPLGFSFLRADRGVVCSLFVPTAHSPCLNSSRGAYCTSGTFIVDIIILFRTIVHYERETNELLRSILVGL
jgi:hypothetical protein